MALVLVACGEDTDEPGSGGTSDFYEGKTIEIVVPYGTGGSNDLAARFLAPLLSKHVEGNPRVQVISRPGGEGILGANEFQRKEHDGLSLILSGTSLTLANFLENPDAEFSLADWTPLIGFGLGNVAYVNTEQTGVTKGPDLPNHEGELVFGTVGIEGTGLVRILPLDILGLDYQLIAGYDGNAETRAALLGGELNFTSESISGYTEFVQPEVDKGVVAPVFTVGEIQPDGSIERDSFLPDIPTLGEVYKEIYGKDPEGELWDIYTTLVGLIGPLDKSLTVHEDAPPEAVEALLAAIPKILEDPDFEEALATTFSGLQPVMGQDLATYFEKMSASDPKIKAGIEAYQETLE